MVNRNGNSQYVTSGRIFTPTPVIRYLTFISGRGRATKVIDVNFLGLLDMKKRNGMF